MGLVGCATEKLPPTYTYTLAPDLDVVLSSAHKEQEVTQVLMLDRIRSTHAFGSTKILYTNTQYGQNGYAYSRWSDAPATMLLLVFQQALEKSGRFTAVVPYTSQSQSGLLLESTLFDFSHRINVDGTSDAVLKMRFYLIDNKTKRVISSREFFSSVPASQRNAQAAVAALNKAAALVAKDLIDWLG